MRSKVLVAFALICAVQFGIGCKEKEAPPTPVAMAETNSTDVAECDTMLKKTADCYANTTLAQQMTEWIDKQREKLKADVQAEGKDSVQTTCLNQLGLLEKNPTCAKK